MMKISNIISLTSIFAMGVMVYGEDVNNIESLLIDDSTKKSKFGIDYPVKCDIFHMFRDGDNLEQIAKIHKTKVDNLSEINPGLDVFSIKGGMPICVVGKFKQLADDGKVGRHGGKARRVGRRPKNLMKYKTTPGVDNCAKFVKNANPLLSQMRFLELNPNVSCQDMEQKSVNVFLPKGTTIEEEQMKEQQIYDQDCVFGMWSDWSVCENGEKNRMRNMYQEASGNGKVCPELFETTTCGKISKVDSHVSHKSCLPSGSRYDGCSGPTDAIFTPACNFRNICWGQSPKFWFNTYKTSCDTYFYILMINTCNAYWNRWMWWHIYFSRKWCEHSAYTAYVWYTEGHVVPDGGDATSYVSHNSALNKRHNGYGLGYSVPYGCSCEGKSCDFR